MHNFFIEIYITFFSKKLLIKKEILYIAGYQLFELRQAQLPKNFDFCAACTVAQSYFEKKRGRGF